MTSRSSLGIIRKGVCSRCCQPHTSWSETALQRVAPPPPPCPLPTAFLRRVVGLWAAFAVETRYKMSYVWDLGHSLITDKKSTFLPCDKTRRTFGVCLKYSELLYWGKIFAECFFGGWK